MEGVKMLNINEVINAATDGVKNELLASLPKDFSQDRIDSTMVIIDAVANEMIEKSDKIKYGCEDVKTAATLSSIEAFKYRQREKAIAFKIISYIK